MNLLIWHNNGEAGQIGYTEEYIQSIDELPQLIKDYKKYDMIVYRIVFLEPL